MHKGAKVPFSSQSSEKSTACLFSRMLYICNQSLYLKWQCLCIHHNSVLWAHQNAEGRRERERPETGFLHYLKPTHIACSNSRIIFFLTFRRPRQKRLQKSPLSLRQFKWLWFEVWLFTPQFCFWFLKFKTQRFHSPVQGFAVSKTKPQSLWKKGQNFICLVLN